MHYLMTCSVKSATFTAARPLFLCQIRIQIAFGLCHRHLILTFCTAFVLGLHWSVQCGLVSSLIHFMYISVGLPPIISYPLPTLSLACISSGACKLSALSRPPPPFGVYWSLSHCLHSQTYRMRYQGLLNPPMCSVSCECGA